MLLEEQQEKEDSWVSVCKLDPLVKEASINDFVVRQQRGMENIRGKSDFFQCHLHCDRMAKERLSLIIETRVFLRVKIIMCKLH
jgi:hypothetical protein